MDGKIQTQASFIRKQAGTFGNAVHEAEMETFLDPGPLGGTGLPGTQVTSQSSRCLGGRERCPVVEDGW